MRLNGPCHRTVAGIFLCGGLYCPCGETGCPSHRTGYRFWRVQDANSCRPCGRYDLPTHGRQFPEGRRGPLSRNRTGLGPRLTAEAPRHSSSEHQTRFRVDMGPQSVTSEALRTRSGVLYALAAFFMWGLLVPLHFKLLSAVPALQILAHRVVWGSLLALCLIGISRQGRKLIEALAAGRQLTLLCLSASLVGINWLVYIWAVNSGHLVQTSLGYFINPLVNVALGVLFLRERLHPAQVAACLLAGTGVLILAIASGGLPWIALALAFSFGFYGLVRKVVPVAPLIGFCIESLLLTPLALGYLGAIMLQGSSDAFQGDLRLDFLLILTGVSTATPLIWFAAAAQRLKLSTLGLLQYLAPSGQLALGVLVYGEAFGWVDGLAFATIWAALAMYTVAALRSAPHPRSPAKQS
jgi:chloramphenicol-sensitive protein RarD